LSQCTGGVISRDGCLARLTRQDQDIECWRDHDQTVLWVDGCLYDQTILVRLLSHFAGATGLHGRLQLIDVREHPMVHPFHGLGQLTAQQLAELLPTRRSVTPAQFQLAAEAWQAMCSADPRDVEGLLRRESHALPHLRAALRRWLEHFPSTRNGLDRLQEEVLEALTPGVSVPVIQVFAAVSAAETPCFCGDTFLWDCINDLACRATPLLVLDGGQPLPLWEPTGIHERTATVTAAGEAVLKGERDAIRESGIDRWIGGVHLHGCNASPWRWDRDRERLHPGPNIPTEAALEGCRGSKNKTGCDV